LGAARGNPAACGIEEQLMILAAHADGVELLETETDRIDEIMTSHAHLVGRMSREPFPVGNRLRFLYGGQIRIGARRRGRNLLAEELFPNEQAAAGRSRVVRLAG